MVPFVKAREGVRWVTIVPCGRVLSFRVVEVNSEDGFTNKGPPICRDCAPISNRRMDLIEVTGAFERSRYGDGDR
jgi:hypothetical protein